MNSRLTLTPVRLCCCLLFLFVKTFAVQGQTPCSDPILISSINITNTTCTQTTGAITVNISGGISNLSFTWSPNVSGSNTATGLAALAYHLHIVRENEPACTLDTTIIVNNTNGPAAQVAEVLPAHCLAADGKVTLSPSNLVYLWSNGETGSVNDGLPSGFYTVKASDPNTNCFTILPVTVPKTNSLETFILVKEQSKCGKANGEAEVLVFNGSGVYSYSLGNSSTLTGLAAGDYTDIVTDLVTGCQDSVTFTIEATTISGEVLITPYNINCPGGVGFVSFEVIPGDNFQEPYSFTLTDLAGQPFPPGDLPAGSYVLQIQDADSCFLQPDTFQITQPMPIVATPSVVPETCAQGGEIHLAISGGNGGYRVDWLDLPGNSNGGDRVDLPAGFYYAIVLDAQFCADTLPAIIVPSVCAHPDTLHRVLKINTSDVFCPDLPVGVAPGSANLVVLPPDTGGSSAYGNWSVGADHCLHYNAGSTPGYAVDTICVRVDVGASALNDTVCLIYDLTSINPGNETVNFTVPANGSATACGMIPGGFTNFVVNQLNAPGLSGESGAYGTYTINPNTGCITFNANALDGANVDTICISVFDLLLNRARLICYVPTIEPSSSCTGSNFLPLTSLSVTTADCASGGTICIPIPFADILDYALFDNGQPYANGFVGCDMDTAISYPVSLLPPGGPYQLNEWTINGQTFTGNFSDLNGLAALMNQIDPVPGWTLDNNQVIRGGTPTYIYGPIQITSQQGGVAVLQPNLQFTPHGTELLFPVGIHQFVVKFQQTGCADTMAVNVSCVNCPPAHNYPLDAAGNVSWNTADCGADTVFCTSIAALDIGNYIFTDNGQPASFSFCGDFVGMRLDTGFHQLAITGVSSPCSYTVKFYLNCPAFNAVDTLAATLSVGAQETVCIAGTFLNPPFTTLTNICDASNGNVQYTVNIATGCVNLTGLEPGVDTLCFQLCNSSGDCVVINVLATVLPGNVVDTLIAVPDAVYTLKNKALQITILENDILGGIVGNTAEVGNVTITESPQHGQADYDGDAGLISYEPDPDYCGPDFLVYRLEDLDGRSDTAKVTIRVVCEKILVYTGFSPNEDGANDFWHILGIEQFPANEVRVFNRWGNLVLEQKGFNNQPGWDGRWNGKYLPDGTYFYLIDLGDGSAAISGYLQLLR